MIFDLILDSLKENIYLSLIFFSFFSQMGVPLGTMFLIMYFASIVYNLSSLIIMIIIIILFTILGDIIAYKIGKKYGNKIMLKYKDKGFIIKNYNKSKNIMKKYVSSSIFLTRFVIN